MNRLLTVLLFSNLLMLGGINAQGEEQQSVKSYTSYLIVESNAISPPADVGLGIGLLRTDINSSTNSSTHYNYQFVTVGIRFSYLIALRAGFGKSGDDIGYRLSVAYYDSVPSKYTELRIIPALTLDVDGKAIVSVGPTLNLVHMASREFWGYELGIQLVPGRWSK